MRAANGYPRPRAADARAADNGSGWDKSFHLANSLGTRSVFKRDAPTTVRVSGRTVRRRSYRKACRAAMHAVRVHSHARARARRGPVRALDAQESSLSSPGFRSRRVSQPAPTGFAPVQLGRARPVSAGAGVRPPLDSIALLQMAAAQRLAAANAESLAGTSAAARPAQRTASLSLTFPPNFPHVARPARTARSAGGSRATPLLAGRVARGGVASAGPARSFSESRLEPAAFPSARDALARDGELLELRLAELQAETAREQAEARALGARVRMQAMAEAEVDAHLAALRTVLATVSADVRLCTAERAAAAKAAMQATRAAATVAEPAALGAAQAAEVAARRARAHASIRALGPAIGSFVAWADELGLGEGGGGGDSGDSGDSGDDGGGDDGARGGGAARAASAEGAGEAGSTPTSPASRVSPLIASARARLLRVDSMLRNVSEVQRAATLLQRAAGQHGGLADEAEAAGGGILANAMVLTPEGRAVPAREVLLRMPPPLPPAGLEPEAGAQRRSGGGGGSRPPDRVARRAARLKAAAAASARAGERPAGDGEIGDGDGDGATRRVTPLPTMLAELHATAEEASLLAAHMRSLSGQRDALARAQSFRQLDADGDGFLNDTGTRAHTVRTRGHTRRHAALHTDRRADADRRTRARPVSLSALLCAMRPRSDRCRPCPPPHSPRSLPISLPASRPPRPPATRRAGAAARRPRPASVPPRAAVRRRARPRHEPDGRRRAVWRRRRRR
jgi:hypothetical protein